MFFRCRHDTNKENGNDVHALQNIYRSEEVKIEKIENNNKNNNKNNNNINRQFEMVVES